MGYRMGNRVKVWLSKYAITAGIQEWEAEIIDGIAYPGQPFMSFVGFKLGKHAHLSREEAVAATELARKKKIASLKKQIAKLEALTF